MSPNPNTAAVAGALSLLTVKLDRLLRLHHTDQPISLVQRSALTTLARDGAMSSGALAIREGVRPPSMTRTINTLVALGLIERTPHPSDGRQVVVSVSRSGRSLLTDKVSARDAWLAGHLSKLSDEQTTVLKQALDILGHLGEAEPLPE
ncbi:MarR family winged helix-turn-helix transcriptional regulator [Nocardia fluminea]|uniref:MarR family winged helix-turn-helix transcriptional regulator n=1 Tax=Nocardia fluminea TaxID=134984 RepID=UPI001B806645|nr:MarR family transcriptional regulator [Nocardia fluminea]